MKKKIMILFSFFTLSSIFCIGQAKVNIDFSDSLLYANGVSVNNLTTTQKIETIFGKASSKVNYPNGEVSYFYEDLGIVIITKNELVKGIGINFNWDGDDKFPKKMFTGKLSIGGLNITTNTKSEDIASKSSITFSCPISILCASKNQKAIIKCMVAFKDTQITQVVFLIN